MVPQPPQLELVSPDGAHRAYLVDRYAWLVRVRWFAAAGALGAALLAPMEGLARVPLCAVALGLAAMNAVFAWRARTGRLGATRRALEDQLLTQLLTDIGALCLAIHFSGGAENPFAMLYPLPLALGATLVRTSQAVALAVAGTACHVMVVLGELSGLLPHHSLDHHDGLGEVSDVLFGAPEFVAGYLVAFALMNFGVVYFARSVTARLHDAEELRRAHDRVAHSRERLARIGELSAGVAHAVRNPVHGLVNAVDLLRTRTGNDAEVMETLELMGDALTRIEVVTRRLLTLGLDSPLAFSACDIDTLVEDTLRLASPRSRDKIAQLDFSGGSVGEALVDPPRLSEAVSNVIDNALAACSGDGRVLVSTAVEADGVRIEVSDNGSGIPESQLGLVFDPFFTTKPVGEGTGLGLAITRRILDGHGGRVTLTSAVGQGTTVRLWLPRGQAQGDRV